MTNWKPNGWTGTVSPYLIVKDANKAIEFYKKAFGAEEKDRMSGPDGKVMHAELRIGETVLMLADEFPEQQCYSPAHFKGTPVMLFMYVPDVDKAFEKATTAGATVQMPVTDMFWGDRYGQVVDPFGHKWSLATHKEDLTDEEVRKRGEAFRKQMAGAHK
jgi:uncharacterized glyoxalase superfamily protein PhnB